MSGETKTERNVRLALARAMRVWPSRVRVRRIDRIVPDSVGPNACVWVWFDLGSLHWLSSQIIMPKRRLEEP